MEMANFLMPKNTSVPEVTGGANADITLAGTVSVRRGPIGDIAVTGNGMTVVTNYGDDTVALINPEIGRAHV